MKMESIVSSETSAIRTQRPGNYPKRNKLHLEHGESLKARKTRSLFKFQTSHLLRKIDENHDNIRRTFSCPRIKPGSYKIQVRSVTV